MSWRSTKAGAETPATLLIYRKSHLRWSCFIASTMRRTKPSRSSTRIRDNTRIRVGRGTSLRADLPLADRSTHRQPESPEVRRPFKPPMDLPVRVPRSYRSATSHRQFLLRICRRSPSLVDHLLRPELPPSSERISSGRACTQRLTAGRARRTSHTGEQPPEALRLRTLRCPRCRRSGGCPRRYGSTNGGYAGRSPRRKRASRVA